MGSVLITISALCPFVEFPAAISAKVHNNVCYKIATGIAWDFAPSYPCQLDYFTSTCLALNLAPDAGAMRWGCLVGAAAVAERKPVEAGGEVCDRPTLQLHPKERTLIFHKYDTKHRLKLDTIELLMLLAYSPSSAQLNTNLQRAHTFIDEHRLNMRQQNNDLHKRRANGKVFLPKIDALLDANTMGHKRGRDKYHKEVTERKNRTGFRMTEEFRE